MNTPQIQPTTTRRKEHEKTPSTGEESPKDGKRWQQQRHQGVRPPSHTAHLAINQVQYPSGASENARPCRSNIFFEQYGEQRGTDEYEEDACSANENSTQPGMIFVHGPNYDPSRDGVTPCPAEAEQADPEEVVDRPTGRPMMMMPSTVQVVEADIAPDLISAGAVRVENDDSNAQPKLFWKILILCSILVSFLAVVLFIVLFLTGKKETYITIERKNETSTTVVSDSPTMESTPGLNTTYKELAFRSAISPYYGTGLTFSADRAEAISWLANEDPADLPTDTDPTLLLERYVSRLLYCVTKGWQWEISLGWLSGKSICFWGHEADDRLACDAEGKLIFIELDWNYLSGTIPREIGFLTNLEVLKIWGNEKLTGSIPSSLGALTDLTALYLPDNSLTGTIPSQLGLLTQLSFLYLYNNNLIGTIPAEVRALDTYNAGRIIEGNNLETYGGRQTRLGHKTFFHSKNKFRGNSD